MEALLCTNAAASLFLLRRRTSPSTAALSALVSIPLSLRRHRSLPTRGLLCTGADWPRPSFVAVAEKLDAEAAAVARKARASAGAGGDEEKGQFRAINDVGGGAVEESVAVPFEQSLVVLALGSKV